MRRSGATRITGCGLGWNEEVKNPNASDGLEDQAATLGQPAEKRKETQDWDGYYMVDRPACGWRRDLEGGEHGEGEGRRDHAHHRHANRV